MSLKSYVATNSDGEFMTLQKWLSELNPRNEIYVKAWMMPHTACTVRDVRSKSNIFAQPDTYRGSTLEIDTTQFTPNFWIAQRKCSSSPSRTKTVGTFQHGVSRYWYSVPWRDDDFVMPYSSQIADAGWMYMPWVCKLFLHIAGETGL